MHCTLFSALCFLSATLASPIRQSSTFLITRAQDQLVTRVDSFLERETTAVSLITRADARRLNTHPTNPLVTRQGESLVTRAEDALDPAVTAESRFGFGKGNAGGRGGRGRGGRGRGGSNNNQNNSSTPIPSATTTSASSPSSAPSKAPNTTIPFPTSSVVNTTPKPTAIAQAQAFDKTATRLLESVTIQSSSSGLCLSIDPNGGDSDENLIPISMVPCAGTPNEKFDIITRGKHNDGTHGGDKVLVVSSLMNGCVSFDGSRGRGEQVNMFSCGGKADGSGGTDLGQLVGFDVEGVAGKGGKDLVMEFQPLSAGGTVCYKGGRRSGKLVAGSCNGRLSRKFKVLLI